MSGTIINALAIAGGALIGLLIRKILPQRLEQPIFKMLGIATCIIALYGLFGVMLSVTDGRVSSHGELLLLVSLVVGCIVGELAHIDDALNSLGDKVERKFHQQGFSRAFLTSSLVFAVGAMAIMGPIENVLYGQTKILLLKSSLDFVGAVVFGATLGIGVVFSALSVFAVQGAVALFARALSDVPSAVLDDVFMVGYAIVLCIGLNFLLDGKIKTANILPALVVPVIYNIIVLLL